MGFGRILNLSLGEPRFFLPWSLSKRELQRMMRRQMCGISWWWFLQILVLSPSIPGEMIQFDGCMCFRLESPTCACFILFRCDPRLFSTGGRHDTTYFKPMKLDKRSRAYWDVLLVLRINGLFRHYMGVS